MVAVDHSAFYIRTTQLPSGHTNALAESFFGSLKNERVHHMVYPTRQKAKEDIARYVELFYNHRRLHSGLGYRTPHEVRNQYMSQQLVA
jgi:putative transposase